MAAASGCDFFFLVFTLIWGPPKIILPRAPQSVRPGLVIITVHSSYHPKFHYHKIVLKAYIHVFFYSYSSIDAENNS